MTENLRVVFEPDAPEWKRFPQPTTDAKIFAAGTVVEDERGVHWEVYWDQQDHQLEWQRAKAGPVPEIDVPVQMAGSELIAIERDRQQSAEGYDAKHDAGHAWELIRAGVLYADNTAQIIAGLPNLIPGDEWESGWDMTDMTNPWPWAAEYWKPTGDPVRDLTKAGALIAAAIDSLIAERQSQGSSAVEPKA